MVQKSFVKFSTKIRCIKKYIGKDFVTVQSQPCGLFKNFVKRNFMKGISDYLDSVALNSISKNRKRKPKSCQQSRRKYIGKSCGELSFSAIHNMHIWANTKL